MKTLAIRFRGIRRCRLREWWMALFLLVTSAVCAQELLVRKFPFERRLFTNEVYDLFQDREGFIWLGTTSGLQRWDGHRLLTFRSDGRHPHLLVDNNIRMLADTPDLLWIVSEQGLTLYNKSNGQFSVPRDERICHRHVDGLHSDAADGMWLAIGQRLYHCNSTCTEVEEIDPFASLPEKQAIDGIYTDSQGALWVMCHGGLLLRGNKGKFEPMPPLPNQGVACTMYEDAQGRYWIGTWGQGLWQLFPDGDGPDGHWLRHHVYNTSTGAEEGIFFCIRQDRGKGWLWMLSYNKMFAFRYSDGKLIPVDVSPYLSPHRYYTKMNCDREGNLWVAAYDEGAIVSFDTTGIRNYHIPQLAWQVDAEVDLPNLYADGDFVWLNQQRHGLQLYNRATDELIGLRELHLPEIATLRPSRISGSVWAGQRYYSTAYRLSRKGKVVTVEDTVDLEVVLPDSRPIREIAEDAQGTLWLLTRHHLVARSHPSGMLVTADLTAPTAFTLSPSDKEVLCVAGHTLYRCFVREHHIACRPVASLDFLYENEEVTVMSAEPSGRVWIATTLGRTFRSDNRMSCFEPSPLDSLLQDGLVQDMLADEHAVWVMNDKRIVHYDIGNATITGYDAGTGVIELRGFRHQSLCRDSDGVLAGGYGGFLHLPDRRNDGVTVVPVPVLTDVQIAGKSIFFDGEGAGESTFRHLQLPAGAHHIKLHLSVLTYFPGSSPRMQYRLEGAETEWTNLDAVQPRVFFNRLSRGNYHLYVRCQHADGTWTKPVEVALIERLPAWFESPLAFVLYCLFIVAGIVWLVWYVRRRHARHLQAEVTQAKVAIITASHRLTDEIVLIVDRHLDDPDFGLEQLLAEMGTSKSTLYRQLKAETDMTPSDLIRSIRLKRAGEMLLLRKKTVSEVAYATGFSSPKYFTRCFKDVYGQTPTEYIRSQAIIVENKAD